jgi:hypothetical protein
MAPAAAPAKVGKAGKVPMRPAKGQSATSHGRGHAYGRQNHFTGDASVASRHVKVSHSRAKPQLPSHATVQGKPNVKSQPKTKTHLPPGPFDVKPPQGNGAGNGNGHSK